MLNLRVLGLLAVSSLAGLVACGDDDDSADAEPTVDAGPQPDVSQPTVDAAGPVDASDLADAAPDPADAAPLDCSLSSRDFGDVGAPATNAFFLPGAAGPEDDIAWATAMLEAGSPSDSLEVELYAGYGVFANGLATGTYTIAGDDTEYETCGLCVMIKTNLSGATHEHDYLATSGTVTITQLGNADGGPLALTLSNVKLRHVDIDLRTGQSMEATACTTEVDSASMSGTLQ